MKNLLFLLLLAAATLATGAPRASAADSLDAKAFRQPPPEARPWVYWFWINANISKEGITADLEAMKRQGIGGFIFMEVALGSPAGPHPFFSASWRELFKHAIAEADRLGIKATINSGPGWTGSGGPWVTPEQSMQKVVFSETPAKGPAKFEAALPQPETIRGFYRDIVVLAFPTPAGKARISGIAEKALYYRNYFSSRKGVPPNIPMPAEHEQLPADQLIPTDKMIDLSAKMDASGRLVWDVPAGDWTIMRFGQTSTGQLNRPAPLEGLESDKLDTAALDEHYKKFLSELIKDVGPAAGRTLIGTHIDSWEVGCQNWTARFRDEFKTRRGYDPLPWLPAMAGRVIGSVEQTERFLWDLRQTLMEMVTNNYDRHLRELAHKNGMQLSIEPYDGNPTADMVHGAEADVPMCEFWCNMFETRYSVKEATSIGHVYGKPIIAAEAFTSGSRGDAWQLHPAAIKPLGDWAFSEGVNRFVIHRYVHQPYFNIRPGLTLGPHGLYYERTNTWWEMAGPWHQYLARCQWMLRQGKTVADVLVLDREGAPNVFQSPAGIPAGIKFDGCTPAALLTRVSAKDGRMVLLDGMSYRLLMLPDASTMTPELLRKIKELADAGVPVLGPVKPVKSPSLVNYPKCDDEVKTLADELWGSGKVISGKPVADVLNQIKVENDFVADKPLRFAHRRAGEDEIYFVSNGGKDSVEANCAFRVVGKHPELWDPETGKVSSLPDFKESGGQFTTLALRLGPAESVFVVFKPGFAAKSAPDAKNWAEYKTVQEIAGRWKVRFAFTASPQECTC